MIGTWTRASPSAAASKRYTNMRPPGFGIGQSRESSAVLSSRIAGEETCGVPYLRGPTVPRVISICSPTEATRCCPLFAKFSNSTCCLTPVGELVPRNERELYRDGDGDRRAVIVRLVSGSTLTLSPQSHMPRWMELDALRASMHPRRFPYWLPYRADIPNYELVSI